MNLIALELCHLELVQVAELCEVVEAVVVHP